MSNKRKNVIYVLIIAAFIFPNCARSWTFIVTGDSRGNDNGVNSAILTEIAAEVVKNRPDFVLFPGDLVNGGCDPNGMTAQFNNWRQIMRPVYDAGIPVYPIRGNHDLGSPADANTWKKTFAYLPDNGPAGETKETYSISHNNALIVALDEYALTHRVNQSWLNSQLTSNKNIHVFVFGHEPAFKAKHHDCLQNYPVQRDAFWTSLKNAGVRVYFCGHDHFFEHSLIDDGDKNPGNDIHQYIVGTAGAPIYNWRPAENNSGNFSVKPLKCAASFGYCLIKVVDREVTITWMQRSASGKYKPADIWSYTAAAR